MTASPGRRVKNPLVITNSVTTVAKRFLIYDFGYKYLEG